MTKRKVFDPGSVPVAFWCREDIRHALACRDVADLLRLFLDTFADCTQTQLALVTQHDRSDISNWIRGVRQGRVSDIEVLTRIAAGYRFPTRPACCSASRRPTPMPCGPPSTTAVRAPPNDPDPHEV
ncbi:hypothetical protein AB0J52_11890 [Spirillospora sp. NPDC049652]